MSAATAGDHPADAAADGGTTNSVPLRLRPYQREALDAILAAWNRGVRRQVLVMATGLGKTVVFAHLAAQLQAPTLILAHRDELLQQAAAKVQAVWPTTRVGLVKADRDETDAPVVLASVQTLCRPDRLRRVEPRFGLVVVDECHHAAAPSYRRILEHLGAFRDDGPLVLGVTATPQRGDGVGLADVFEEIVFQRDIRWGIEAGYLSDLRAVQVFVNINFDGLSLRHGDFRDGELSRALQAANAPAHVVAAYQKHAAQRKALVFTPTVDDARATARAFEAAGIAAGFLSGMTPADERRALLEGFRRGEPRVLCNCGVLTEGFDEPSVDCVVVARPTRSRALYLQMIGRGTRRYPGKQDCLVIDLVGVANRHRLMTAATLFGLPPAQLAERTVTEALSRERERQGWAPPVPGVLVSRVLDLLTQRFAWVQVSATRFVLVIPVGVVWLDATAGGWVASVSRRGEARRALTASPTSLELAQGIAEDFAREAGAARLARRDAPWRKLPATERQIETLRRLRVPVRAGLTRGEASDLISLALGRWTE